MDTTGGVSLGDFLAFKNYVNTYNEQNDKDVDAIRDTQKKHHERLNDLEKKMDLLSKMSGGSGGGANTADLLDALTESEDKLRQEFDDKLNSLRDLLMEMINELEKSDKKQQEDIDEAKDLLDDHNLKLEDLQKQIDELRNSKCNQFDLDKESNELRSMIEALNDGKRAMPAPNSNADSNANSNSNVSA